MASSILACAGGAAGILLAAAGVALVFAGLAGRKKRAIMIAPGAVLLVLAAAACLCAGIALLAAARSINYPTTQPTNQPSTQPTNQPSNQPSSHPTTQPTNQPTTATHPLDVAPYAASLLPGELDEVAALDDPPVYTLDARVDWEALTVSGHETLLVTNNEDVPLDSIFLRLYPNAVHYEEGEIEVGTVLVDGDAVAPGDLALSVNDTALEVTLPGPLRPEQQVTLSLPFTVTVPRRADRFGFEDDVMMLGHWYPMLAVYDDEGWNVDPYVAMGDAFYSETGFYTVLLVAPEETVVAATGVEVQRERLAGGEARVTLVSGGTRDFALALSPRYVTRTRQAGGTTVTAYVLPGDESGGQVALDVAADAIEVFNEHFGLYPYTEFDVAETPFLVMGSPGGMEFPGIVFISTALYDAAGHYDSAQRVIVAHEVAHQWWYGVVGNNQVDEPWLDESLASFSELLYTEEVEGAVEALAVKATWLEVPYMMAAVQDEDRPVASSLLSFDDAFTYGGIVYSKGGLFLVELRELVGEDTFYAICKRYYATYRYTIAPPDGLRRTITEVTGGDEAALALYDLWILSGETPEGYFD